VRGIFWFSNLRSARLRAEAAVAAAVRDAPEVVGFGATAGALAVAGAFAVARAAGEALAGAGWVARAAGFCAGRAAADG
jgi:hypothetical protein